MAEGERGPGVAAQPRAVADVDALAVAENAVLRSDVEDGHILECRGPRGGEAASGLGGAGDDVRERRAELLAAEVALDDRRDVRGPRQYDRRSGVDDHDGARVRGGDGADEVVLTSRQIQGHAVVPLGLDLGVGAHHDDGDVGVRGGRGGAGDERVGIRLLRGDAEGDGHGSRDRAVVGAVELGADDDLVPGLHPHGGSQGRRVQEGRTQVGARQHRGVVEHDDAVDEEASGVRAGEAELDLARGLGGVDRLEHDGARGGDGGVAAEPHQGGRPSVLGEQFAAVRVEEAHAHAGLPGRGVAQLRDRDLGHSLLHHGAQFVRHALGAERVPQTLEGRHDPLGHDGGAAPALGARVASVLPDHGDGGDRTRLQGKDAVVGQQDRAGDRRLAGEGRGIQGGRLNSGRIAEGADALGQEQHAQDLTIQVRLGHAAVADGLGEIGPRGRGPGHREVLRRRGRRERTHGRPVAHDDAVEAPLRVQRGLEQLVLGHRHAVDRVVRAHDRPRAGLDRALERRQVQLAQRALVHVDVDGEAVGLGVVGDVVLRRRRDAVVLEAADVGGRELGRELRVLAEALEMASAERGAVQVDRGAEHHVDPLPPRFGGRGRAVPVGQFDVPRGRERRPRRHVQRGLALVPPGAADPGGPVRQGHGPQPDLGEWHGRPEVGALDEGDLLLESELLQERDQVLRRGGGQGGGGKSHGVLSGCEGRTGQDAEEARSARRAMRRSS
ncbi:hypothetical protein SRABI128_02328 [Microbacterium sp. Bi128]|nr:hypothetical protein SRABI128_02328 [Microbacterium sp. Bi128]